MYDFQSARTTSGNWPDSIFACKISLFFTNASLALAPLGLTYPTPSRKVSHTIFRAPLARAAATTWSKLLENTVHQSSYPAMITTVPNVPLALRIAVTALVGV